MSIERRAGAPRLIEWTGERCVPWTWDVQVVYEHFHRYLWAADSVRGRKVLDLASGEGFGSAILADVADSVVGVDIDAATVEHSRLNYAAPNLEFREGSALDLGEFEDGSFDAVVCFEMIEHVSEQGQLLAEVDRVLADDGLLIMSTPDRRMYSEATGTTNPFHERELTEDEFRALLAARFPHVGLWGQRTITGSRIATIDGSAPPRPHSVFLERAGEEWRQSGDPAPLYLIAVASHTAFAAPPSESTLADYSLELMRQFERDAQAARDETARAQQAQTIAQAEVAAAQADAVARRGAHESELEGLTRQLIDARNELDRIVGEHASLAAAQAKLDESVTWSLFQKAQGKLYGKVGKRSLPGQAIQASLRGVGRLTRATRPATETAVLGPPVYPPVSFPAFTEPKVSLIIPVHSQADLTFACLRSIERNTESPTYEVILVDDTADEATKSLLRSVENATILVNEQNLGFLRSMNRGAAAARGEFLILFNNDTEVQPGWLEALVDRAESAPDIGVVSPKLLFPDGHLQEAGGIVFRDGSAWNFGRDDDPDRPQYNYAREIDYGTAACVLVRSALFSALGGFDERFAPIYYEDTDLGFAARDRGYRVMYEPRSRVVHVEGATSGTDLTTGSKRFQALNQPKFVDKWQAELAATQLNPSPVIVRHASDRNRGPHVLIIDHRILTPDRDSGSLRMLQIIKALQRLGCRVTFLPDNLAPYQPYTERLQAEGVEVLYGSIDLAAEIASIGPYMRLAIVSRPYVAGRYMHMLRAYAPGAVVAYDTVDLHFVREGRRAELGQDNAAAGVAASMREIELGLVRASDATIVVTEEERAQVLEEVPGARIEILPNANDVAKTVAPPDGRRGILFVGGFEHLPNVDAAQYLARSIMPLVWRRHGDATLTIVGGSAPPEVLALSAPGIDVAGWVEDLDSLIDETRVMVAPLRYGAGMKGKVTQSLAAGLPVVTTSIGAEGLAAEDGRDMLIADDPEDFAAHIVRLCEDDALWTALSGAGQELVRRTCSPETMTERVKRLLDRSA